MYSTKMFRMKTVPCKKLVDIKTGVSLFLLVFSSYSLQPWELGGNVEFLGGNS